MKLISTGKALYLSLIISSLCQTSVTFAEKKPHYQNTQGTHEVAESQATENSAIAQLAEQWARLLDDLSAHPPRLNTLFSSKSLNLELVTGNIDTHEELQNWLIYRRKQLESSQHLIQNMKITKNKDNSFTLEFEFLVEEKQINGPREISRLKEKWRALIHDNEPPLILEIYESYLLPQTHSGARIQC